ncbi:hypothetical protein [Vibrio vulnificus YJ016]|uniref:Uncharacterized protein n=1 Tax=Vibrio vulnificus (strain YJ016) TaxID=196600 RepID=Q7MG81_VIBVY|nr:hypothetical protein [Vibrio vulnificus YJ016]
MLIKLFFNFRTIDVECIGQILVGERHREAWCEMPFTAYFNATVYRAIARFFTLIRRHDQ